LENICHAFRLAAALILTPACKAQEVSPDHFTDTGIEGISPVASTKAASSRRLLPCKRGITKPTRLRLCSSLPSAILHRLRSPAHWQFRKNASPPLPSTRESHHKNQADRSAFLVA
jgi:hypothetical protein